MCVLTKNELSCLKINASLLAALRTRFHIPRRHNAKSRFAFMLVNDLCAKVRFSASVPASHHRSGARKCRPGVTTRISTLSCSSSSSSMFQRQVWSIYGVIACRRESPGAMDAAIGCDAGPQWRQLISSCRCAFIGISWRTAYDVRTSLTVIGNAEGAVAFVADAHCL